MTATVVTALHSCSSHRYVGLVHDLLQRYRREASGLAVELAEAMQDLRLVEDELRFPELPRSVVLLTEHESITTRIERLERDLADAREAVRGAEEELAGIEAALDA